MRRIARLGWLLALSLAASSAVALAAPEQADGASGIAAIVLDPLSLNAGLRAALGYLRLVDTVVTAHHHGRDWSPASSAPLSVTVVPSDAALAPQAVTLAAGGRLPRSGQWRLDHPCPRSRDAASADPADTAPAGAALEVIGRQGTAVEVELADGSFAWLDGAQVSAVPAPDALPPLPAPTTDPTIVADAAPLEGQ